MLAKSAWPATTRTGVGTAGRSDRSICVRLSEKSGSDYDDPRMDSVPLLESDVREAEALAEVLHVLDHVVQAADEDLLVSVVVDVVLDDLLDIAHAAFPIGRLGTRNCRVEVEIRMLPLPFLDEAAVDQVMHVSHAEHDMELVARVEAVRPDVAHHRDERGDAGPRRHEHGVVPDRLRDHEATERADRLELRPRRNVVEVVRHEPALHDLDAEFQVVLVLRPRCNRIRAGDSLAIFLREDRDELARLEVEHGLIFEGETDQVRLRKLRGEVENFLHNHGVFAGSELHGGLLNGGFRHPYRLRRNRPANHSKVGTLHTNVNISSRLRNNESHACVNSSLDGYRDFSRNTFA